MKEQVIDDQLILIFNSILDLKENSTDLPFNDDNIRAILNLIIDYIPIGLTGSDDLYKNICVIYIFSFLLNNANSIIKINEAFFFKNIYFKNVKFILEIHLPNVNMFFNKIIDKIFEDSIKDNEYRVLTFMSINPIGLKLIKKKIFDIFLSNIIFDISPFSIVDYRDYYYSTFKYIFFMYIEMFSKKVPNLDDLSISTLGNESMTSSRYNIYRNGIRLTQINAMCYKTPTLKKVHNNIADLKHNITTNELQKLYSLIVDKNVILDSHLLILKFNCENENLLKIKKEYPSVYKLLRSLKIKEPNLYYNYYDKKSLLRDLESTLACRLNLFLEPAFSKILAEAIAIKIEKSITEGCYLDPFTLTKIEIKGKTFVGEMCRFVNMILDYIDTEEKCSLLNSQYYEYYRTAV